MPATTRSCEISKDPATFSSAKGVLIGDLKRTVTGTESILYVDPPRHVAMRRIVNRGFTVRRVAQLTPILEGIVADVLDAIDPSEPSTPSTRSALRYRS